MTIEYKTYERSEKIWEGKFNERYFHIVLNIYQGVSHWSLKVFDAANRCYWLDEITSFGDAESKAKEFIVNKLST